MNYKWRGAYNQFDFERKKVVNIEKYIEIYREFGFKISG